jgi:hypothetical protein
MPCVRWTPPEITWLDEHAGQIPFADLVARMHRKAKREGWPVRSADAIISRLHRTGQHALCRHGEWLTLGGAAEIMGFSNARVREWIQNPRIRELLEPKWVGKGWYIHRSGWKRLAREMPRVLGGCSADQLFDLLEDRELAESVASRYKAAMGDWRVRCIENGRIYRSASAAARELHVTQSAISLAIKQRRPVRALGLTFEALRSAADPPQPLQVRNRAA